MSEPTTNVPASSQPSEATEEPEAPLSDDQVTDVLPADLDATAAEPITFPNNDRRRIPAVIYLVMGVAVIVATVVKHPSPFVNTGLAVAGGVLCLFGLYGLVAGRTLVQDETDALVAATAAVGFPVGHASAQMAWKGVMSRPVWRLLVYSDENPPQQRAMVVVNGVTGEVEEWFAEANPEDWG